MTFRRSVKANNYEMQIQRLLEKAIVLDHSKSPCDDDFLPTNHIDNDQDRAYVVFIKTHSRDYATWLKMASCFGKYTMYTIHTIVYFIYNNNYIYDLMLELILAR